MSKGIVRVNGRKVALQKAAEAKPARERLPPREDDLCPDCGGALEPGEGKAPVHGAVQAYLACNACPYFWSVG